MVIAPRGRASNYTHHTQPGRFTSKYVTKAYRVVNKSYEPHYTIAGWIHDCISLFSYLPK